MKMSNLNYNWPQNCFVSQLQQPKTAKGLHKLLDYTTAICILSTPLESKWYMGWKDMVSNIYVTHGWAKTIDYCIFESIVQTFFESIVQAFNRLDGLSIEQRSAIGCTKLCD